MKHLHLILTLMFSGVFLLSACKGPMADLSDDELFAKHKDCKENEPTTPGRGVACENVSEECKKRDNVCG